MTIPQPNELYNNVLSLFSDVNDEYHTRHVKRIVADLLDLSPEERNMMNSSGREPLIEYHLGWTLTGLKKAGLLESKRRGYVNITELGLKLIKNNPNFSEEDLKKIPEYVEFKKGNPRSKDKSLNKNTEFLSENYIDIEQINYWIDEINSETSNRLINKISDSNFSIFKKIIIDLLFKLEYYDFQINNENNNEFNGLINNDKLGLEKIVIHAINTSDEIKTQDIQLFAGLIVSKGLTKGIFITSSSFNDNAREYVKNQANLDMVLIDGKKLANLMIENDVGSSTTHIYKIKKVNEDYFNSYTL